ncbi:hypothetical protein Sjap_017603 [Stephania japonica]|uniref:DYW domain-containing protein n=1 Tax=Stephania japonica TaxID=461633 RepID=A0AAP0I6H3_9MAGN
MLFSHQWLLPKLLSSQLRVLLRYISSQENLAKKAMNPLHLDFSSEKSYMGFSQKFFKASKFVGSASDSRKLHACLVSTGFDSSVFLQNHLLHMYFNWGSIPEVVRVFEEIENPNVFTWNTMIGGLCDSGLLEDARKLFDEMPVRDCVSWNSIMSGYFQNGRSEETLKLFILMSRESCCDPDQFSFTCALKACASLQLLELGLQLHCFAKKFNFSEGESVELSVLDMYVKCGAMSLAEQVFDRLSNRNLFCWNSMIFGYGKADYFGLAFALFTQMPERDAVSWNTMISLCSQHGFGFQTISLFVDMCNQGFLPDSVSYSSVLSACASILDIEWGRHLHAWLVRSEFVLDVFVGSSLISMYAKCGKLGTAKTVFENLPEKNVFCWTSLIKGLAQFGFEEEALVLFKKMREVPLSSDQRTLATLLGACSSRKDVYLGTQFHGYAVKIGFELDVPVANSLITMYSKCKSIVNAKLVFNLMPSRDVISWTAMITAFSQIGDVENASACFKKMPERNVVTWNSLLAAYVQNGYWEEGLKTYVMMLKDEGVKPDWTTYSTIFGACADSAMLRLGKQIIARTAKIGWDSDVSVANGIITMYSRCGQIEDALMVFDSMRDRDLISWNAMITGYAQNGQGRKAVQMFDSMISSGIFPDHISYVGVLSGCSHSGLVSEGKYYFDSMTRCHGIDPNLEHFACTVDLLGRAGLLEDAKKMIDAMPIQPSVDVWGAMLSACRIHGNTELAELACKHLIELDPVDSGSYVLLAKTYADAGKLDSVVEIRKTMRERGVRKNPGCSWIEAGNKVHVFTADDTNHPQIKDVYKTLEEVTKRLEDACDYMSKKSSSVSHGYHSEKLAVAFGLMSLPSWMPIHIMKNIRICTDCHDFIKLVSHVTMRKLVVRDANRFHHFSDGSCSCGDYW